ncbi:hypothetical protein DFO66_103144 [Brevibacterium sanguinis]|uniref:VOC domain-containing protein n=2 Tax=Brevibacterium TaxID=1696 RepID=A0A366IKB6_9MICO|nr:MULTISPECIES: VOC family protein [Brevibacterium]RBP66201.1 hypothetical protein DFO66_103144 [Brevibacterium sanguinis]RBP72852.1 hypothetical protein DFO65_103143 [Brevibacterium celere]
MIDGILANCPVADLDRAEDWYTRLFERGPDQRPMTGLLEWHLGESFGFQVWADRQRAGGTVVVLQETALDDLADRLTTTGIDHSGPEPGGGARILRVRDPDGNLIVCTGD